MQRSHKCVLPNRIGLFLPPLMLFIDLNSTKNLNFSGRGLEFMGTAQYASFKFYLISSSVVMYTDFCK